MRDLLARRVAGWSMKNAMTADLITDALGTAIRLRGRPDELLDHSDQAGKDTGEQGIRPRLALMRPRATRWREDRSIISLPRGQMKTMSSLRAATVMFSTVRIAPESNV